MTDGDKWGCRGRVLLAMRKIIRWLIRELSPVIFIGLVCVAYYLYVPRSAVNLHERIAASDPNVWGEEREKLADDYAKYLARGLPRDGGRVPSYLHLFFGNQRKILDLRLDKAIKEIEKTAVTPGAVRVWSLFNMGVVVKTSSQVIAFDIADMPLSNTQQRIAELADVILVTHADGDHYDPALLKKALLQGKTVVLPENFRFMYEREGFTNVRTLKYGEGTLVNGMEITAWQTDHRGDGDFFNANAWYRVEVDGIKLLHTGDGRDFQNPREQKNLAQNGIDVFLCNMKLHPYDIRDVNPQVAVPIHSYKFLSGREELENSTFAYAKDNYDLYDKELRGIGVKYLLPGESFEYGGEE